MADRQGAMENLELADAAAAAFWRGKRVLVTRHTGFKGGWLAISLHSPHQRAMRDVKSRSIRRL